MKRTILSIVAIVLVTGGYSQSITPVAIGSGYVNGSSSNAEISSTVGQTAFEKRTDGTSQITEGVHQPALQIINVEEHAPKIGLSVYPNPSGGRFNIQLLDTDGQVLEGELFDVNGVSIQRMQVTDQVKQIDISHLPSGSYFFHVYDSNGIPIKQYKVMKVR